MVAPALTVLLVSLAPVTVTWFSLVRQKLCNPKIGRLLIFLGRSVLWREVALMQDSWV